MKLMISSALTMAFCLSAAVHWVEVWCCWWGIDQISYISHTYMSWDRRQSSLLTDSPWVVHCSSEWVWFNYYAVIHGLYWTQRETIQHVTLPWGGCQPGLRVSSMLSSPAVQFFSLRECLCALCVWIVLPRRRACWLAELPCCRHSAWGSLWDNLASLEDPLLERHQSWHARGKPESEDALRTARAVETRQGWAMKRTKSQLALRPGRGLEGHKSSSLYTIWRVKYGRTIQNTTVPQKWS